MSSPNLSELVTTTQRRRTGKLADNMAKNIGLLYFMKKKGNMTMVDGGRSLVRELEYAENSTFQYYSGYDTINIQPSDVISAAEYDAKQASTAITISGREQRMNSGKEAVIKLLSSRWKNAEKTLMNGIGAGLYANGTGSGGLEIDGLQKQVSTSPTTGTVGGIDAASFSFWRNQVTDFTSDVGAASSVTNFNLGLNKAWVKQQRNGEQPNLIVMDNDYFEKYLGYLQGIQRIVDEQDANLGFRKLSYLGTPVICDGGYQGSCPTSQAYLLNTDYLFFETYKGANFETLGSDERQPVQQDAFVRILGWMGNMTCSNRFLQGVLKE